MFHCAILPSTGKNVVFHFIISYEIVRITKRQNKKVVGLSEAAKARRKHRNLVTMKFNLMNYVLESGTMLLFGLIRNEYISILYFVVNCCGTPLVYYIGMEENRRQAQDYFRLLLLPRNIL